MVQVLAGAFLCGVCKNDSTLFLGVSVTVYCCMSHLSLCWPCDELVTYPGYCASGSWDWLHSINLNRMNQV